VGGDLYDFFLLDDNHLLFLVGDVSDKGVPAALFMAVTKTLLKGMADPGLSPGELLSRVNRELCQGNDTSMFVTLFCAIMDLESGKVAFANGGHNPPLLLREDGTVTWLEVPPGLVLGILEESDYTEAFVQLAMGDQLLLYTDGVTEAQNEAGEFYSEPRLLGLAEQNGSKSPQELVQQVLASVYTFVGQASQADDITLLAVRFRGAGKKVTRRD
jgi:sigma-B regulation protein RsbU (phosphoserine phosphatase)